MVGGVAVVTGATGGLGYETALGLARAGLGVVLTGRDAGRGAAALARLRAALPGAAARFELLDVADPARSRRSPGGRGRTWRCWSTTRA